MHFLSLHHIPNLGIKQHQRLILSYAMQQAFQVLKMPVMELAEWLKTEIDQNYVIDYEYDVDEINDDRTFHSEGTEIDFEKSRFEILNELDETFQAGAYPELEKEKKTHEVQLSHKTSLFAHLMHQAEQTFTSKTELKLAEQLIGNLDERGFLTTPLDAFVEKEDLKKITAILKQIQTFDPAGVGARNLQESLLIQLRLKNKEKSLAYAIIEKHFNELMNNRIPLLQKKTKSSTAKIQEAIASEIQRLDLHPGYRFLSTPNHPIVPDVIIKKEDDEWCIEVNNDPLPNFRISSLYSKSLTDPLLPPQEKEYLRRQMASGKWLQRILNRRNNTLKEISYYLLERQREFINGEQNKLVPMTMQEVALKLNLHESTIARAVAHKYIALPHGLFPLRKFFTHGLTDKGGQLVSNHTIKQLLAKLIQEEDKSHPLSDEALSNKITHHGVPCARRTVAKYRQSLKIAPASHRRKF